MEHFGLDDLMCQSMCFVGFCDVYLNFAILSPRPSFQRTNRKLLTSRHLSLRSFRRFVLPLAARRLPNLSQTSATRFRLVFHVESQHLSRRWIWLHFRRRWRGNVCQVLRDLCGGVSYEATTGSFGISSRSVFFSIFQSDNFGLNQILFAQEFCTKDTCQSKWMEKGTGPYYYLVP